MYKGNRFIASVIFSVLCFAINDGFWDPNYRDEKNCCKKRHQFDGWERS